MPTGPAVAGGLRVVAGGELALADRGRGVDEAGRLVSPC